MIRFHDRRDAGRRLGPLVRGALVEGAVVVEGAPAREVVVVGLPRGGVPVAAEVADSLGAPLDVVVVRKVGAPHHVELAAGAVGEGGVVVRNEDVLAAYHVDEDAFAAAAARERRELERRVAGYRAVRSPVPLAGCTVVVVDDGLATGATASAACRVVRAAGATRVVLAVPVAPAGWQPAPGDVDAMVCDLTPVQFRSVGDWYEEFRATPDAEVIAALSRPRGRRGTG